MLKILYVDDEPLLRAAFQRLFRQHTVRLAESGETAFDILQKEKFDVVVSDLMMSGMSGLELHAKIQDLDPSQAQKFIFVSGEVDLEAIRKLGGLPNRFLSKPWDREELARVMERVGSLRPPSVMV